MGQSGADLRGQIPHADVVRYVLSGHAIVTFHNTERDTRFTYKITAPKEQAPGRDPVHFVSLLSGPDNETDYVYLGCIFSSPSGLHAFRLTRKSKLTCEAPAVRAFDYVFNRLAAGVEISLTVAVWHEGKCGRCGRTLTVPESVASGFGPVCIDLMGVAA